MRFNGLFLEHGLSLDRLKSFLDVVDAGSIVKAAEGDSNRQSQYSRQIKELEVFFGAELTRRKGRRIEITDEGERLARLVRSSFMDLADFRADSQNEARRAVVAAGASVIEWLVAPAFFGCRKALENTLLETRSMRSGEVVRALDDGQVDFGILRADAVTPSLSSIPIGPISYALFMTKALAPRKRPNSVEAWGELLSRLPQARLVEGGRFRRVVDEAHQALMIRPSIVAETTSLLQLAALVKEGHCSAILPQTAANAFEPSKVASVPLNGFLDYKRELQLVYCSPQVSRRGWGDAKLKLLAQSLGSELDVK